MKEKYAGPPREPFEKRLARSRSAEIRGTGKVAPVGGDLYRYIGQNEYNKQTEDLIKYDEANRLLKNRAAIENVTMVGEFSSSDGTQFTPKVVKHKNFD